MPAGQRSSYAVDSWSYRYCIGTHLIQYTVKWLHVVVFIVYQMRLAHKLQWAITFIND